MGRSIAAVVVGFLVIGALAFGADAVLRTALPGVFSPSGAVSDPAVLLGVLGYVTVFAVFGCYLAARIAPRRPMAHAIVLGLLGLAFNIVGTIARWGDAPAWYHVIALLLVMPSAWLGGWLRERELRRRSGGATTPVAA